MKKEDREKILLIGNQILEIIGSYRSRLGCLCGKGETCQFCDPKKENEYEKIKNTVYEQLSKIVDYIKSAADLYEFTNDIQIDLYKKQEEKEREKEKSKCKVFWKPGIRR